MIHYPVEKWTRFALGAIAFSMALLLTPRALLDVDASDAPNSYEVPVDMLEPSDDCLWCTAPGEFDAQKDCEDFDDMDRHWLNADQIQPPGLNSPCRDDEATDEKASEEPSA